LDFIVPRRIVGIAIERLGHDGSDCRFNRGSLGLDRTSVEPDRTRLEEAMPMRANAVLSQSSAIPSKLHEKQGEPPLLRARTGMVLT
jgi:hypothetical protein